MKLDYQFVLKLDENETKVVFPNDFNLPLKVGDIPNTVTHLTFGKKFNQELKVGDIPSSVTHLNLGDFFNQKIVKGVIPNSVTNLHFGYYFNQVLEEGVIPSSVTHITFSSYFNRELTEGLIPASVTHLTFGWDFNQKLKKGDIPASVTNLTLGQLFNQELEEGVIPSSVTHLTFSEGYKHKLKEGTIPSSVTHLKLHFDCSNLIEKNSIPNSVTHLEVKYHYYEKIEDGVIPDSVTHLTYRIYDISNITNHGLVGPVGPVGTFDPFVSATESSVGDNKRFNGTFDRYVPKSVTHFKLEFASDKILEKIILPESVSEVNLRVGKILLSKELLPKSVKQIYAQFYSNDNYPITIQNLDMDKVSFYSYGTFKITPPETHEVSESYSSNIWGRREKNIIDVYRKVTEPVPSDNIIIKEEEPQNIYLEKVNQLKNQQNLENAVKEFEERLMKSTTYGPIDIDYQGDMVSLKDAIQKEMQVEVNVTSTDNGVSISY